MFYQGDLQSGIATAMREAKPVICFVRGMSLIRVLALQSAY